MTGATVPVPLLLSEPEGEQPGTPALAPLLDEVPVRVTGTMEVIENTPVATCEESREQ